MEALWHDAMEFYEWTLSFADPRVMDWPLIDSPLPTLGIVMLYYLIIFVVIPKLMKDREPVDFGLMLPVYNFMLVALNVYILQQVFVGSYNSGYSYVCTPHKTNDTSHNELMVANGVWWYYISKILELFDTVLFALRKRDRQITFLHVYHHSTMPLLWWIGVKWVPTGQTFVSVLLNSGVHVVMYSYYALSALGPKIQKHLWWKKYITILQLIQFVVAIFHTGQSIYIDCPSPRWMHWALIAYAFSFIILFGNFYIQSYSTKKRAKKEIQNNGKAVRKENANGEQSLRRRKRYPDAAGDAQ